MELQGVKTQPAKAYRESEHLRLPQARALDAFQDTEACWP